MNNSYVYGMSDIIIFEISGKIFVPVAVRYMYLVGSV
jgi:hypothetical protein